MNDRYILSGGIVFDGTVFLRDGAILVDQGEIAAVGPSAAVRAHHAASTIDVGGRLILPGLLDAHTHLYSSLAAGLVPDGPLDTFPRILENLWWRLDAAHDEESVYHSAMAGIIDRLRCGVTTIFDHHASMGFVTGSLDVIAGACEEAGVRATLCFEVSERAGLDFVMDQIEENVEFHESHREDPFLRGTMGLHANFTLSDETLSEIAAARPADMPIHVHAGEAREDLEFCRHGGFEGPVDRLQRYHLLDEDSILVHAVHLSNRDAAILRDTGPVVVLAPESNANNGVGRPDASLIPRHLLGTDGMSPDIVATLRARYLDQHAAHEPPAGMSDGLSDALFGYRREVQQRFFPGTGDFTVGARADIAVLDYIPVTPITPSTVIAHLVHGARQGRAWLTAVDGRVLLMDGAVTFVDEERFRAHARKVSARLHERFHG